MSRGVGEREAVEGMMLWARTPMRRMQGGCMREGKEGGRKEGRESVERVC